MTDNSSVDAAASWVLDNQDRPEIDEPFKVLYEESHIILKTKLLNLSFKRHKAT